MPQHQVLDQDSRPSCESACQSNQSFEVKWELINYGQHWWQHWQQHKAAPCEPQCCNSLFAELGLPHAATHMNCGDLIWAQYTARELRTKCSLVILDLSSYRRHLSNTATVALIEILILLLAPNFTWLQAIHILIHSQLRTSLNIFWSEELWDDKTLFFPSNVIGASEPVVKDVHTHAHTAPSSHLKMPEVLL